MPDPLDIPTAPFDTLPRTVRHAWDLVSGMPFENLTKVVSFHRSGGRAADAIRLPEQVLSDHRRYRTGGTCFALVALFRHLLQRAGLSADLVTCDRYTGPDTHAAAVFQAGTRRWMFDPGYHIVQPLPVTGSACCRLPSNPNVSRVCRIDAERYECYTGHRGHWRLRFVLKDRPLDDRQFRQAWQASFQVDMMAYPVLNRFEDGRMIYLQKSAVVVRDLHAGVVEKIPVSDLAAVIRETYGIAPEIAHTALRLMKRN